MLAAFVSCSVTDSMDEPSGGAGGSGNNQQPQYSEQTSNCTEEFTQTINQGTESETVVTGYYAKFDAEPSDIVSSHICDAVQLNEPCNNIPNCSGNFTPPSKTCAESFWVESNGDIFVQCGFSGGDRFSKATIITR